MRVLLGMSRTSNRFDNPNMRRNKFSLFLVFLLCHAPLMAQDEKTIKQIHHYLEQMSTPVPNLNFEGNFVYRVGEQLQGVRVVHGFTKNGVIERMMTLNGPHREIIRDNGVVKCQLKEDTAFMVQQAEYATPFKLDSPEKIALLEKLYELDLGGRDRVAGLNVQRINVIPKDRYRFGYRLWIADENNHMLLRSEMVDEQGKPLEQVMFTSLKFLDQPPESLLAVADIGDNVAYINKKSRKTSLDSNYQTRWVINEIPPGYQRELARGVMMPEKQKMIEHQLYSDGFSSVSVFFEPSDQQSRITQDEIKRIGPVTFVSKNYDGFHVTVVGEVPRMTANLIADSVSFVGDQ